MVDDCATVQLTERCNDRGAKGEAKNEHGDTKGTVLVVMDIELLENVGYGRRHHGRSKWSVALLANLNAEGLAYNVPNVKTELTSVNSRPTRCR